MELYQKMSIDEKLNWIDQNSNKSKALSILPDTNPQDNQLQRALMQFYLQNQVVSYPNNNETFIAKGYSYNPHVYTVISWKGRNASQVPFELFKVVDKDAKKKYLKLKKLGETAEANYFKRKSLEEVETGGLADILKKPNGDQSMSEFIRGLMGYMDLTGNLYVYGLTPSGYPEDIFGELYIAPSQLMEIISGGWMRPVQGYKVNYSWDKSLEIAAEKICHQKNWNPRTDFMTGQSLYGMSALEPLLRTIKTSNESEDAHLAYMVNGSPAGVLSNDSDRDLSPNDKKLADDLYDRKFSGGRNVNKIIQSASKLSWLQIGLPVADLQLLEADKASQKKINNAFGVPDLIFSNESSTYNNLIQAQKDAWQNVLIPDLKKIRDGIFNGFLVPGWSARDNCEYYVDFDTSEIPCLQTDMDTLTTRLLSIAGFAALSPNELLIELGKEPIADPNMDKRYMDNKYHELGTVPQNPNFSQGGGK